MPAAAMFWQGLDLPPDATLRRSTGERWPAVRGDVWVWSMRFVMLSEGMAVASKPLAHWSEQGCPRPVLSVRVCLAALAVAVLVGGGLGVAVRAPAQAAPTEPAPVRRHVTEVEQAAAAAKATGRPVEVASATTQTQHVVVNPDGTFTLRVTAVPVRT